MADSWKHICPGVFINHATEELISIGSFITDNNRPFQKFWVIDDQRAALATDEILAFVETLRGETPEGPGIPVFKGCK